MYNAVILTPLHLSSLLRAAGVCGIQHKNAATVSTHALDLFCIFLLRKTWGIAWFKPDSSH